MTYIHRPYPPEIFQTSCSKTAHFSGFPRCAASASLRSVSVPFYAHFLTFSDFLKISPHARTLPVTSPLEFFHFFQRGGAMTLPSLLVHESLLLSMMLIVMTALTDRFKVVVIKCKLWMPAQVLLVMHRVRSYYQSFCPAPAAFMMIPF